MNETRLRVIQEQLKLRYKDVWDFEFLSDSPEYDAASQKEDFLATIAYFVHFILGTEELADLFESLVSYYSRLEASDEVEEVNRSLMEDLREFARMIKSSPKWPKFLSDVTHPGVLMSVLPTEEELAGIESPADLIDKASATITIAEFIERLSNLKGLSGNSVQRVERITQEIWRDGASFGTFEYLWELDDSLRERAEGLLSEIRELVARMKQLLEFNIRYSGAYAATQLRNAYHTQSPEGIEKIRAPGDFLDMPWRTAIAGALRLASAQGKRGKRAARQVYQYLQSHLSNRLAKQSVIRRFKAYCQLYKCRWLLDQLKELPPKKQPEAFLQDFLEEFVFNHGYYPISEAKLGRGRLDVLVTVPTGADFLIEVKQIGWGRGKKTIQKTRSALVQASIYKQRLEGYETLTPEVYITVFTDKYRVIDGEQPIRKLGIDFYVEIIPLIDAPVSEWKTPEILSLENVVKE